MSISRNHVEETCAFIRRWAAWIARQDRLPLIHAAYQRTGSANRPRPLLGLAFQDGAGMSHWQLGAQRHAFPDLHAAILCCTQGSHSDPVTGPGGLWISSFDLALPTEAPPACIPARREDPTALPADSAALLNGHAFIALPIAHPPAMRQAFLEVCRWHQQPVSFSQSLNLKAAWLKLLACFHDQIRQPAASGPHHAPIAVQRALAHVHHHYHDAQLCQGDLADVAHQDPHHFGRVFKQVMGLPPMRYVRQVRLRQAAHLLETTDHPIAQIAHDVGFNDAQHFTKVFTSAMGCPPTHHRQKHALKPVHKKTAACD